MVDNYLNEENIDDLARMVIALTSEMWILRDRVAVLEELLVQREILAADSVESFQWSPEMAAQMEKLRDRMIGGVLGAPTAARERSIDQILARADLDHAARKTAP